MRAVLGIIVGIIAGLAAQSAMDALANWLHPASITNMWDRAQIAAALAARPTSALLIGVAGYFLGGLVGGAVGKKIWRAGAAAWTPGAVLAAMALIVGFSYPIPTWAMFATFVAPLLGALLANHLVAPAAPAAPAAD